LCGRPSCDDAAGRAASSSNGGTPILVVLLPILPCLLVLPLAVIFIGVVLPLWIVSFVVMGTLWIVVVPLDGIVRAVGGAWTSRARARIERILYQLSHPKVPDRWRRR
jgi:uncharacterized membrane protein